MIKTTALKRNQKYQNCIPGGRSLKLPTSQKMNKKGAQYVAKPELLPEWTGMKSDTKSNVALNIDLQSTPSDKKLKMNKGNLTGIQVPIEFDIASGDECSNVIPLALLNAAPEIAAQNELGTEGGVLSECIDGKVAPTEIKAPSSFNHGSENFSEQRAFDAGESPVLTTDEVETEYKTLEELIIAQDQSTLTVRAQIHKMLDIGCDKIKKIKPTQLLRSLNLPEPKRKQSYRWLRIVLTERELGLDHGELFDNQVRILDTLKDPESKKRAYTTANTMAGHAELTTQHLKEAVAKELGKKDKLQEVLDDVTVLQEKDQQIIEWLRQVMVLSGDRKKILLKILGLHDHKLLETLEQKLTDLYWQPLSK